MAICMLSTVMIRSQPNFTNSIKICISFLFCGTPILCNATIAIITSAVNITRPNRNVVARGHIITTYAYNNCRAYSSEMANDAVRTITDLLAQY